MCVPSYEALLRPIWAHIGSTPPLLLTAWCKKQNVESLFEALGSEGRGAYARLTLIDFGVPFTGRVPASPVLPCTPKYAC